MDNTNKKPKGEQDMQLLVSLVIRWPNTITQENQIPRSLTRDIESDLRGVRQYKKKKKKKNEKEKKSS